MASKGRRASQQKQDADEKWMREVRGRRKFRAIVRIVMANLFWMADVDDSLGSNVKLNIQKLTRKKAKKSDLTTQQKILLMKPVEERTEEEKRLIDKAIGGLRCFRKYPRDVKAQLAAVTYFVYIGPGRVIVRQNHAPTALYFMLSGEAVVTIREYDKLLNEWVETNHGTVGPGTMLGEVALLHGITRTATLTTTVPCELLSLKKEHFDVVLKETVWKAWEQTSKILNTFSYFKNWDPIMKRECSIISRMASFQPDDVIIGDDCGLTDYSYLVTKGTVYIIEQVMIHVIYDKGIKKYKLVNPEGEKSVEDIFGTKDVDAEELIKKFLKVHSEVRAEESAEEGSVHEIPEKRHSSEARSRSFSKKSHRKSTLSVSSFRSSLGGIFGRKSRLETHFLKVCEMNEGAVFNIGENFFRRRVVAKTATNCLLIPRFFLIKMNKDYIWSRVKEYLNRIIPNTQQIFKNFLEEQKFKRYRRTLMRDIINEKNIANENTIHNVPYSIRLKEGSDYL